LPTVAALHERSDVVAECAVKFSAAFLALFLELWHRAPFPIPADSSITPELRAQLVRYPDDPGVDGPPGAVVPVPPRWGRPLRGVGRAGGCGGRGVARGNAPPPCPPPPGPPPPTPRPPRPRRRAPPDSWLECGKWPGGCPSRGSRSLRRPVRTRGRRRPAGG